MRLLTTSIKKLKSNTGHGDNHYRCAREPSLFIDNVKGHDNYVYSRCGQEKLHYSPTGGVEV